MPPMNTSAAIFKSNPTQPEPIACVCCISPHAFVTGDLVTSAVATTLTSPLAVIIGCVQTYSRTCGHTIRATPEIQAACAVQNVFKCDSIYFLLNVAFCYCVFQCGSANGFRFSDNANPRQHDN